MVVERHEGGVASPERVHQQDAGIARDGDEVAPAGRRDVAPHRDRPARGRLIGRGRDQLGWIDRHEALVAAAEQLARHAPQGLGPGEPHPPCERDDTPLRVHRVQRAVGAEGRLHDSRHHGVDAAAPEIERQHVLLVGHHEQEFRLRVEADDVRHGRQLSVDRVGDLDQIREAVGPRRAAARRDPDRYPGGARAAAGRVRN